jgi:hypothetical protein
MTINEAINKADALKPNNFSFEDKIGWLSTLDHTVMREMVETHEGGEDIVFTGYNENTDPDTELLAPAPYDEMYLRWLEAQIDYANNEFGKYNNAITMFNTSYGAYFNYYNRTHMPKGKVRKYFG